MAKIEGITIRNYGSLRDVVLGKTYSHQDADPLNNMITIIGPSGNGKSTIADVFGFIADCLDMGVEAACDANNRGGYDQLITQGAKEPISFEIYYRETSKSTPITYELVIGKDKSDRPYVVSERLRYRNQKIGRPLSFLYLQNGKGYAFEGRKGGQDEEGKSYDGEKKDVSLTDVRHLGIVTIGSMKQFSRIGDFLNFLRSWYLCYFLPDTARKIQTAAPQPYLDRNGSNINNVAQYMYRDNKAEFMKVLQQIQTKLPGIEKILPERFDNGQMMLKFWETGFQEAFYSPKMSDGTLKLFAYYLLLHEKNPRQLVFIEEPENGLYHHYLADLAREMVNNVHESNKKQLFVTTHSPFFVNALNPRDVWVLTKDREGFSSAKRAADYEFVKELSEEGVALGDMWYSKYFG